MRQSDLTGILTALQSSDDLGYRQGFVQAWNAADGTNTIVVAGATIQDVPFLMRTEALAIQEGDVVGLLRVKSQYFVLGRISVSAAGFTITNGGVVAQGELARFDAEDADLNVLVRMFAGLIRFCDLDDSTQRADLRYSPPPADVIELLAAGETWMALATNDGSIIIDANGAGQTVTLTAPGGVRVESATTGSSANVVLSAATAALQRSTSSRRYKSDIDDFTVSPADALKLRPRSWRDRLEVEADPDTTRRYVGFVAEEVHALGLGAFVDYDEKGRPDAIAYDRLSVALLAVVRHQEARLARLEALAGLAPIESPPTDTIPPRRPPPGSGPNTKEARRGRH